MITTFLIEYPWITTTAFAGVVLLGPVVGLWLAARPRLAGWLGLASLVPAVVLTLAPTGRELEVGCAVEWSLPTFGAVEIMANVVLFAVPVLLLGVALRAPWRVSLAASAASALIEAGQAVVTALGRSCSTNDWLANTLGAGLGATLATLALWLWTRRR